MPPLPRCSSKGARSTRRCWRTSPGDLLRPHQPVRLPARCRRRAVRGRAPRQGGEESRPASASTDRAPTPRAAPRSSTSGSPPRASTSASFARRSHESQGGALGAGGGGCTEIVRPRPHRPPQGRRDRWPHRLGRRRGDRGPLRGRPLPRSLLRVTGPVVSHCNVFLGGFRWLGGRVPRRLEGLFPALDAEGEAIPAVVLHNAPGRYRPITDAIARALDTRVRRSTWSILTSPTAG